MYVRTAITRNRKGLGDFSSWVSSWLPNVTWNPLVFLPADWNYLTSPSQPDAPGSGSDTLSNVVTGRLTQAQLDTIAQQGKQNIVQASGGNPALAAAQTQQLKRNIAAYASMTGGPSASIADLFTTSTPGGPLDPSTIALWVLLGIGGAILLTR